MPITHLIASAIGGEVLEMVSNTGLVAKSVLLILLLLSLMSWGVIVSKWGLFRRAQVQSARFIKAFRKAGRLQELAAVSEQFRPSPLVPVLKARWKS